MPGRVGHFSDECIDQHGLPTLIKKVGPIVDCQIFIARSPSIPSGIDRGFFFKKLRISFHDGGLDGFLLCVFQCLVLSEPVLKAAPHPGCVH